MPETAATTTIAAARRPLRGPQSTSAVPSARRAHLIAKAKQLSERRAERQQQETQRLAQLQASLATATHSSAAATQSNEPISHELDPLIATDDALHTRYVLQTQQLQRKLAEQQDNMQQLSETILRLQHAIQPEHGSHSALAMSPAFYQQENTLLHSHVALLQQRVRDKEEEVALLSSLLLKKSARVGEVREEASVVVDEMRAAVRRLGADKERREREMREEREQLMSGLREMIDRCVRENEWMRLRLGEEDRAEMERWKEGEESRTEERELDRQRVLKKERQREQEKQTERDRVERAQLERLQDERQREEAEKRRRQKEAESQRQKEEDQRKQQEELKQPEPDSVPPPTVVPHVSPRPSLMLTDSSSTAPSPVSASRRVHFRHPSASPTVFYEPAPSSAPSSPQPLPLNAAAPNSSNHLVPLNLGVLPHLSTPVAPASFPPPIPVTHNQLHYLAASSQPATTRPYPPTSDALDFDAYFSGAAAQAALPEASPSPAWSPADRSEDNQPVDELRQPFSTRAAQPASAPAHPTRLAFRSSAPRSNSPSITAAAALNPAAERYNNADVNHLSTSLARPSTSAHFATAPDVQAQSVQSAVLTQPVAASSISDRVMGRIGGWMLGTAGRERVMPADLQR